VGRPDLSGDSVGRETLKIFDMFKGACNRSRRPIQAPLQAPDSLFEFFPGGKRLPFLLLTCGFAVLSFNLTARAEGSSGITRAGEREVAEILTSTSGYYSFGNGTATDSRALGFWLRLDSLGR
jgi:hypothetical protein